MIYLALDTCVWFMILKAPLTDPDYPLNIFDELLFYVRQNAVKLITSENIIDEWNRNKTSQIEAIVVDEAKTVVPISKIIPDISVSTYTDQLRNLIEERISKVDALLTSQTEKAPVTDEIVLAAWERNRRKDAPNHKKDSFRDTVNILSILSFIKQNNYAPCFFASNDSDYYTTDPHTLHPHLQPLFDEVNLEYIYFQDGSYSKNKLFNTIRKTEGTPDYQNYLVQKRQQDLEARSQSTTVTPVINTPALENEYLQNLYYIDRIISTNNPSHFEKEMIRWLISNHPSYKQYFLRKVGENGLV